MKAVSVVDEVPQEESCIGRPPIDHAGGLTMMKVVEEPAAQLVEPEGGSEAIE